VDLSRGAPVVIRPGGVGQVLDAGIRLARRHFRLLVVLVAWGIVPLYVGAVIVSLVGGTSRPLVAANIAQHPSLIVLDIFWGLAGFIVGDLVLLAVLFACGRLITGEGAPGELAAGNLYRLALGRLGPLVVLYIIFVVLYIPLLILFPLGIFLVVRWCVCIPALVYERKGPFGALARSWYLTRGSWWHTLGTMLVWAILVVILYVLLGGIAGAIGTVLTLSGSLIAGTILSTIAGFLVALLVTPVSAAIYAVLYYELRARREGFDLALRAQQAPEVGVPERMP
jgi:hypothetical protein